MKATVKFTEKSSSSRITKIEGLGNVTLNLIELPFKVAGNSFSAITEFKKGDIVKVKFLTLHENGKQFYTPIENDFSIIALNNTIEEKENIQFVGERTVHSTEFDFDVENIKSILFSYTKMTPEQADNFDAFEEGGKVVKQPDYKDRTDMSRENDGR